MSSSSSVDGVSSVNLTTAEVMTSVDEDDEEGRASKQTAKVLNHLVRSAAAAKTPLVEHPATATIPTDPTVAAEDHPVIPVAAGSSSNHSKPKPPTKNTKKPKSKPHPTKPHTHSSSHNSSSSSSSSGYYSSGGYGHGYSNTTYSAVGAGPRSPTRDTSKELYFRLENISTSSFSCVEGESVIYYRLLGCCNNGTAAAATCGSLFLQWVKLILGRAKEAYLSSNPLLSLLPLALGAAIGFYFGDKRRMPNQRTLLPSFIMQVPQTFLRLCLHLMIRGQYSKLNAIENKKRESGVDLECVPRHVAVIMDGNRRYGKEKYGNSTRGHIEGSKKLIKFTEWCLDEGIEILTVYAFSTENWNRPAEEVSALMSIFCKYCNELRPWAIEKGIRIHVLATESERIPEDVRIAIEQMEVETRHCTKFTMNICLSYGGRNEIVNACKSVAIDLQAGKLNVNQIAETVLQGKMLTSHCCDPEVIIRTSGEERISNFLLWQAAYSEFFFLKKPWPALEKDDLLDVIRDFANGRTRRFGK